MDAECVQCGYCCTVGPCPFGTWDAAAHRCVHLTEDNACGIYDDIIALPREQWEWSPAFGAGCSSSLNSRRLAILRERRGDAVRDPRIADAEHVQR